ncbi:MAG: imidazoleglycerol-phosphate dehydratase HisB [Candidatus Saganbacteria bacterium]|nr:imidazoleglycerol-phosphate dehydratase HisB [Candidatus Saganbacteria bacterium]
MKKRKASLKRKTSETDIKLDLVVDGTGKSKIKTGIGFFDHMLELFSKHGLFDLKLSCKGDIHIDMHHTVEDVGIVLGQAFRVALGDKKGIERYAENKVPMDEALAEVVIDVSGRPHLTYAVQLPYKPFSEFDAETVKEFFEALVLNAGINIHINLIRGENTHHIIEAIFKAFAVALRKACQINPRKRGVPSTKGIL